MCSNAYVVLKFYRPLAVMLPKCCISEWLYFSKHPSCNDTSQDATSVKFQIRWSILNTNIATWIHCKTVRLNVPSDIETSEIEMNSCLKVDKKSVYSVFETQLWEILYFARRLWESVWHYGPCGFTEQWFTTLAYSRICAKGISWTNTGLFGGIFNYRYYLNHNRD